MSESMKHIETLVGGLAEDLHSDLTDLYAGKPLDDTELTINSYLDNWIAITTGTVQYDIEKIEYLIERKRYPDAKHANDRLLIILKFIYAKFPGAYATMTLSIIGEDREEDEYGNLIR